MKVRNLVSERAAGTLTKTPEGWRLETEDGDLAERWERYRAQGITHLTKPGMVNGTHTDSGTITTIQAASLTDIRRAFAPCWSIEDA